MDAPTSREASIDIRPSSRSRPRPAPFPALVVVRREGEGEGDDGHNFGSVRRHDDDDEDPPPPVWSRGVPLDISDIDDSSLSSSSSSSSSSSEDTGTGHVAPAGADGEAEEDGDSTTGNARVEVDDVGVFSSSIAADEESPAEEEDEDEDEGDDDPVSVSRPRHGHDHEPLGCDCSLCRSEREILAVAAAAATHPIDPADAEAVESEDAVPPPLPLESPASSSGRHSPLRLSRRRRRHHPLHPDPDPPPLYLHVLDGDYPAAVERCLAHPHEARYVNHRGAAFSPSSDLPRGPSAPLNVGDDDEITQGDADVSDYGDDDDADVDVDDSRSAVIISRHCTALHEACAAGAPASVVRAIADAWPGATRVRDPAGRTPLYYAACSEDAEAAVVATLLELEGGGGVGGDGGVSGGGGGGEAGMGRISRRLDPYRGMCEEEWGECEEEERHPSLLQCMCEDRYSADLEELVDSLRSPPQPSSTSSGNGRSFADFNAGTLPEESREADGNTGEKRPRRLCRRHQLLYDKLALVVRASHRDKRRRGGYAFSSSARRRAGGWGGPSPSSPAGADADSDASASADDFRMLHSSLAVPDCPHRLVRLALAAHPEQARTREGDGGGGARRRGGSGPPGAAGRLPLHIALGNASLAPRYRRRRAHRRRQLRRWWRPRRRMDEGASDSAADVGGDVVGSGIVPALVDAHPPAAGMADPVDGRLPLHAAVAHGWWGWDDCLGSLLEAAPRSLTTPAPPRQPRQTPPPPRRHCRRPPPPRGGDDDDGRFLHPFMLAASARNGRLSVVYDLFRACPELERFCGGSKAKKEEVERERNGDGGERIGDDRMGKRSRDQHRHNGPPAGDEDDDGGGVPIAKRCRQDCDGDIRSLTGGEGRPSARIALIGRS